MRPDDEFLILNLTFSALFLICLLQQQPVIDQWCVKSHTYSTQWPFLHIIARKHQTCGKNLPKKSSIRTTKNWFTEGRDLPWRGRRVKEALIGMHRWRKGAAERRGRALEAWLSRSIEWAYGVCFFALPLCFASSLVISSARLNIYPEILVCSCVGGDGKATWAVGSISHRRPLGRL